MLWKLFQKTAKLMKLNEVLHPETFITMEDIVERVNSVSVE